MLTQDMTCLYWLIVIMRSRPITKTLSQSSDAAKMEIRAMLIDAARPSSLRNRSVLFSEFFSKWYRRYQKSMTT